MAELEVTVLKYESDYSKRNKDLKRNHWFSFPNDLLLHPDFDDITGEEFKWFCWIVSICSKVNSSKIRLNVTHAEKKLGLDSQDLFSMFDKLKGKQIDTDHGLNTAAARPHDDRITAPTARPLHNITEHNTTLHNKTKHNTLKGTSVETDLHPLIEIWNLHSGKLAKVKRSNPKREKKIKAIFNQLTQPEWVTVIGKLAESDFCNGKNNQGWKADFDFLIQPETYLKVLEGKYDNRTGYKQTHINNVYDQLDALEAGLNLSGERDAN